MRTWFAIVAVWMLGDAAPAHACFPYVNPRHQLDSAYRDDLTAPTAVAGEVHVEFLNDGGLCDIGRIELDVASTDDRAPAGRVGHRVRHVVGEAPLGLTVPAYAVDGDRLVLNFSVDDDEPFAIRLEVIAVDLNDNASLPVYVDVVHTREAGGCAAGTSDAGVLALAAALGLVVRRRRRRG